MTPFDLQSFVGASLKQVKKLDYSWFFRFDEPMVIATESAWRFITPKGLSVTSEDHGELFGLTRPVDVCDIVFSSLSALSVKTVSLDEQTGDLVLTFADRLYLQFLQMSGGYEAWRALTGVDETICLGGGALASVAATPRGRTPEQG